MNRKSYRIYFSGAISGGRQDAEVYRGIISHLKNFGDVLTDHIGDPELTAAGEKGINDDLVFRRDMAWIRQAEIFVAEVSSPSLGVGYEIAQAEHRGKPVLCLFSTGTGRRLSAMIAGNPAVRVVRYSGMQEAIRLIDDFFSALDDGSVKADS